MITLSIPFLLFLLCIPFAHSQAPANATGICKDGTYTTSPTKDTACKGHKGIHTWSPPPGSVPAIPTPTANRTLQSVSAPTPGPAPASIPAAAPVQSITTRRAYLLNQPPAPGGGPNLVWLNGSSKVYHCPDSDFYGKTKSGSYMPESEARAKGAHPNRNKPCS